MAVFCFGIRKPVFRLPYSLTLRSRNSSKGILNSISSLYLRVLFAEDYWDETSTHERDVNVRIKLSESLFGIVPVNETIGQAKSERLGAENVKRIVLAISFFRLSADTPIYSFRYILHGWKNIYFVCVCFKGSNLFKYFKKNDHPSRWSFFSDHSPFPVIKPGSVPVSYSSGYMVRGIVTFTTVPPPVRGMISMLPRHIIFRRC